MPSQRQVEIILRAIDEASPTIEHVREVLTRAGAGGAEAANALQKSYRELRSAGFAPLDPALEKIKQKILALQQAEQQGIPIIGGYAAAFQKLEQQLASATGRAESTAGVFSSLGTGSGSILQLAGAFGIASTASQFFIGAVTKIKDVFEDGIRAALEEDAAVHRLQFTLNATGDAGATLTGKLEDLFKTIQKTTIFTDDQAREAFTQLALVTGSAAEAQQLLARALDIAFASGKDLDTIVRALAVTVETGTETGKKFGLVYQDVSAEQLKVADSAERVNLVLQGTERYAGAAADGAKTLQGQLAITRHEFSEFFKEIGHGVVDATGWWLQLIKTLQTIPVPEQLKQLGATVADESVLVQRLIASGVTLTGTFREISAQYTRLTGASLNYREEGILQIAVADGTAKKMREAADATRNMQVAFVGLAPATGDATSKAETLQDVLARLANEGVKPTGEEIYNLKKALEDLQKVKALGGADAFGGLDALNKKIEETKQKIGDLMAVPKDVGIFKALTAEAQAELSRMQDIIAAALKGSVPLQDIQSDVQKVVTVWRESGQAAAMQYLAALKSGVVDTGAIQGFVHSLEDAFTKSLAAGKLEVPVKVTPILSVDTSPVLEQALAGLLSVDLSGFADQGKALSEMFLSAGPEAESYLELIQAINDQHGILAGASPEVISAINAIAQAHLNAALATQLETDVTSAYVNTILGIGAALGRAAAEHVKAMALIKKAVLDGIAAVLQALAKEAIARALAAIASYNYPGAALWFAAAAAASAGAAFISSSGSPKGKAASGGIVAGTGFGDRHAFDLEAGELILPRALTQTILGGKAAIIPSVALAKALSATVAPISRSAFSSVTGPASLDLGAFADALDGPSRRLEGASRALESAAAVLTNQAGNAGPGATLSVQQSFVSGRQSIDLDGLIDDISRAVERKGIQLVATRLVRTG